MTDEQRLEAYRYLLNVTKRGRPKGLCLIAEAAFQEYKKAHSRNYYPVGYNLSAYWELYDVLHDRLVWLEKHPRVCRLLSVFSAHRVSPYGFYWPVNTIGRWWRVRIVRRIIADLQRKSR